MLHKGARVEGADYFDDMAQKGGGGILGGLGQDDYEEISEKIGGQGLEVIMNCRTCGTRDGLILEWEKLYVVGTNGPGIGLLLPQGWQYSSNNHTAYPMNELCRKCAQPLCPQVTPAEARQLVNDGISRGLLNPQIVQMWQQRVMQMRAAQGG